MEDLKLIKNELNSKKQALQSEERERAEWVDQVGKMLHYMAHLADERTASRD